MIEPYLHPFVGRRHELALLDDLNQRPGAKFLVVYGRRRVGKTRLFTHWAATRQTPMLYWMARQTSSGNLLASFTHAFNSFVNPATPEDLFSSFRDWEGAFKAVAEYAAQKPFVLVLDEFTYAAAAVQELTSELQASWDHVFRAVPLFLIISGSQVNMMMQQVHSARAPLYGRATARLHLRELPYAALPLFFPNYKPEDLVTVYAMMGGVPAYLEKFDPTISVLDNLRQVLLVPNSQMQNDALLLLHEQFEEPRNYAAIIEAIAHNMRTRKTIADYCQLDTGIVGKYLNTLVELGLVQRRLPVTAKRTEESRKGRYHLTDNYLRFYYRFIDPRIVDIETNRSNHVFDYIRQHLNAFVGQHAFEFLCRDWMSYMANMRRLPTMTDRVGGYWGTDAQIDVFGINEEERTAMLGECKWGASPVGVDVVRKLITQAPKAVAHLKQGEKYKTHLFLFVRAKLTKAAEKLAHEHQIRIITLEELDRDLREDL